MLRWLSGGSGLLVLAVVALRWFGKGPSVHLLLLCVTAAALVLLCLLSRILGPRLILAGLSYLLTLLALLVLFPGFFVRATAPVLRPRGPLKIHRPDRRYVFNNIPKATIPHRTLEFQVTYHIDDRGFRVTPTPSKPAGRITLLGCSFTFGHGVSDTETYAHLLAAGPWKRYKVRNRAVMGWGACQAYLSLEEELSEAKLPHLVLYGFIYDHLKRSYASKRNLRISPGPFPFFDEEGGKLVFRGYKTKEQAIDLPWDELEKKELRVVAALVKGMFELCRAKKVPFFIVFLPQRELVLTWATYPLLRSMLRKSKVPFIDLSESAPDLYFAQDNHPTREWHRIIARALAESAPIRAILRRQGSVGK